MNKSLSRIMITAAVCFSCFSCLTVDYNLGADFLETDQIFDIYTASFPIENIEMRMTDSLSGYTQRRITIGAINDPEFGLTKRACALTIVPCYDSLDFGTNPRYKSFAMNLAADTISLLNENDRHMLQSVYVYEMTAPLDDISDINAYDKVKRELVGSERITKGIPVYNGSDSYLSFEFTEEYGKSVMDRLIALDMNASEDDTLQRYIKSIPGIFIETDEPVGYGGRINMFDLQMGYNTSSYTLENNFAELDFTADYGDRKDVDTSFLFYFGPDQIYDVDSLLYYTSGDLPQYCLNLSSHETRSRAELASDYIYVEGGGGLKPVVRAKDIQSMLKKEIASHSEGATKAIINKVSLVFPFQFPDNYLDMDKYPQVLSPTCRIWYDDYEVYSYAGLTDSSAEDENQGDVNRSTLVYEPDITYHAQALLGMDDDADLSNYDIWLLIMTSEEENTSSSVYEEEQNEYYNNLMYASYYNSMYGGYGYGSYSGYSGYGYGSYGSSYSNYYSYYLMSQLYGSSSSSSTSYTLELDRDRFYRAYLYGPQAEDESKRPRMEVTYSIPRVSR